MWVHELFIIETGHIDARFKHEDRLDSLYAYKAQGRLYTRELKNIFCGQQKPMSPF